MNDKSTALLRSYDAALRKHLKEGAPANLQAAQGVGRQAMTLGLETLDLARIHQRMLIKLVLPEDSAATRAATVRRAAIFFAQAITPIEKIHRTACETQLRLDQLNQTLRQRSADLAASKRRLKQEIEQRRLAEESLSKSEKHYGQLLGQSRQMQEQLRYLSRQLLKAQEDERKRISRELHDVIAQTLTSINVRLANLKKAATGNTRVLERNIARTQDLVDHSVQIIHRFARELRPTVLDDLGLIPALHTFLKQFRTETGMNVSLSAFPAVEEVDGEKRTVLYRVAQEALVNIARHAQATRVDLKIRKLDDAVSMTISDNGKGFDTERVSQERSKRRLGLLGMRERVEMVKGTLTIHSEPGRGTSVQVRVPRGGGGGKLLSKTL